MIKAFTITNYLGDSIVLEMEKPDLSGFSIKSVKGLGPSKANINTTEVSTNDGSMFNSARLNERNIVFELEFYEDNLAHESIEDLRQKTYKYFPMKKTVEIQIETDNRIVKTIGNVESNEPNIFSIKENTQISIICPDPYFYSVGEEDGSQTTVFYGIEATFEFPFSNESLVEPLIEFGNIQNKSENLITYNGDAEIGLTIQIHAIGTVGGVTIYNTGTRETMKIDMVKLASYTGQGLVSGDDIIINTVKGEKSITLIRNGVSTNILNCLDKASKWFSLTKGDNIFAFTATIGTENLQFWITNDTIYEGV
ncbi:MAG: phage tail family protein [Clostridia bacterium]